MGKIGRPDEDDPGEKAMDPIKPGLEADQHNGACIPSDLVKCGLSCYTMSAVGSDFTGALATLKSESRG